MRPHSSLAFWISSLPPTCTKQILWFIKSCFGGSTVGEFYFEVFGPTEFFISMASSFFLIFLPENESKALVTAPMQKHYPASGSLMVTVTQSHYMFESEMNTKSTKRQNVLWPESFLTSWHICIHMSYVFFIFFAPGLRAVVVGCLVCLTQIQRSFRCSVGDLHHVFFQSNVWKLCSVPNERDWCGKKWRWFIFIDLEFV